jgi:hypothetical protein
LTHEKDLLVMSYAYTVGNQMAAIGTGGPFSFVSESIFNLICCRFDPRLWRLACFA